jgi:hypothetical protein
VFPAPDKARRGPCPLTPSGSARPLLPRPGSPLSCVWPRARADSRPVRPRSTRTSIGPHPATGQGVDLDAGCGGYRDSSGGGVRDSSDRAGDAGHRHRGSWLVWSPSPGAAERVLSTSRRPPGRPGRAVDARRRFRVRGGCHGPGASPRRRCAPGRPRPRVGEVASEAFEGVHRAEVASVRPGTRAVRDDSYLDSPLMNYSGWKS